MTYATGTATDLEDLLAKLSTFCVTTHGGWTEGYLNTTNGWFELHKGDLSVSFKYVPGGTATTLSVHHATAFVGTGTAPGAHTADSGNGYNTGTTGHSNANLETERCVRNIGNGPYPSYHFFADDTDNDYVHVVVEVATNTFRHFGFGILDKFGDNWVGGEYVYGHYQDSATNAVPTDVNTVTLLDGLVGSDSIRAATIRIASGLPNQSPAVWGVSASVATGSIANDTAGNARRQSHGGFRCGMVARGFGNLTGNASAGMVPLLSIDAFYRDPSNPRVYYLGNMPDVRAVNIRNFDPKQEITIGSDTWIMFPLSIKTVEAVAGRTANSGIAYRKVV